MSLCPPSPLPPTPALSASWQRCHRALFGDPTMPSKEWETNVARYLHDRGYGPGFIRRVLDFAALHGTVACCSEFDIAGLDRDAVEAMLPERVADWHHPRYAGRWTTTEWTARMESCEQREREWVAGRWPAAGAEAAEFGAAHA